MGGEKIGESILYKRTRCIKSCRSHELILTRWLGELSSATSKKHLISAQNGELWSFMSCEFRSQRKG